MRSRSKGSEQRSAELQQADALELGCAGDTGVGTWLEVAGTVRGIYTASSAKGTALTFTQW